MLIKGLVNAAGIEISALLVALIVHVLVAAR